MDIEQHVVFIHTQDTELALRLVKMLNQAGISGFWVTDEEAQKLAQVWRVDAVIRDRCDWRNWARWRLG
jgi:hypothetical protein